MSNRTKNIIYSLVLLAVITTVYFYRKHLTEQRLERLPQQFEVIKFQGNTMGSYYAVQYLDSLGRNLQPEIDSILEEFNASVNTYDPNSELSRLNLAKDTFLVTTSYLDELIRASKELVKITEAAYDPTITPALRLWGFFGDKENSVPSEEEIDSIQALFGPDVYSYTNKVFVKKDSGVELSFNAAAPGYAADILEAYLSQKDLQNYYVDIGGEIVTNGYNPEGKKWAVGIDAPVPGGLPSQEISAIIELSGEALATSGNYRNFFKDGEKTYGHTFDPALGTPVQNEMLSATVVAPTGMLADALATACMVRGKNWALDLAKKRADIEVFVIYVNENKELTKEWSEGLTIRMVD